MKTTKSWFNRVLLNEWRVGRFVGLLNYKTKLYGKRLVKIDEAGTTKTCSRCGHVKEMTLKDRIYECGNCGLVIDRDDNSSINILKKYTISTARAARELVSCEFK